MSLAEKITAIAENVPKVYEAGKQAEYDRYWDIKQDNGNKQFYSYAFYYWENEIYNPKYPIYCKGSNTANQTFRYAKILDTKVDITIYSNNSTYVFAESEIQTIKKLKVTKDTSFLNWFMSAYNIKNLTIEGIIANDFDIHWSTKLSKASITNIISVLSSSVSGKTVTISNTAKNNAFTDEEWQTLVATKPNWTIVLV